MRIIEYIPPSEFYKKVLPGNYAVECHKEDDRHWVSPFNGKRAPCISYVPEHYTYAKCRLCNQTADLAQLKEEWESEQNRR